MLPFRWSFSDWSRALLATGVGLVWGAAIWWLSPWAVGRLEPWDAAGWYYAGSLFAAGATVAVIAPHAFWTAPLSVFGGQLLYCLYAFPIEEATLWPLGLVFAAIFSMAALAGGVVGGLGAWSMSLLLTTGRWLTRQTLKSRR